MEGEKHPRNDRGESHRVFSACYFLVLTGGFFRAHARPSVPANADKGQRNIVGRPFLCQASSETQRTIRMPTCPSWFLIFKKSVEWQRTKKEEQTAKERIHALTSSRCRSIWFESSSEPLTLFKGFSVQSEIRIAGKQLRRSKNRFPSFHPRWKTIKRRKIISSRYPVYEIIARRVENYRRIIDRRARESDKSCN